VLLGGGCGATAEDASLGAVLREPPHHHHDDAAAWVAGSAAPAEEGGGRHLAGEKNRGASP
jgi:hypothetical protein